MMMNVVCRILESPIMDYVDFYEDGGDEEDQ